jgi:hypothetical protein
MKKEIKNQNKIVKIEKIKNHKKKEKPTSAALTGQPSIAPTRVERSSAPLTGVFFDKSDLFSKLIPHLTPAGNYFVL